MPVRVFSQKEKDAIKEKLLEVGFPLLKEYGLIHMSVPKITQTAGIGTGTFYRFFESKEEYISEVIVYRQKKLLSSVITEEVREGRRKLSKDDIRSFLLMITDRNLSVYANMNLEEESKLFEYMSKSSPNLQHETEVTNGLLRFVENVREDIDYALLTNMVKILAITSQARNELHEEGYERTVDTLVDSIMKLIFGD